MKKKMIGVIALMLVLAAAFPLNAFAATKKVQTKKIYDSSGKLQSTETYTYDKYGNVTKHTLSPDEYGLSETMKITYWTGTSKLKKVVRTAVDKSVKTENYTNKGILKDVTLKEGGKTVQTGKYKNNGKYVTEATFSDGNGKFLYRDTYNEYGKVTSSTYRENGKKVVETTKYTVQKGVIRKSVTTMSTSDKFKVVCTFDQYGHITKNEYTGTDGVTYTNNYVNKHDKDGYLTEVTVKYGDKVSTREVYTYTSKKY